MLQGGVALAEVHVFVPVAPPGPIAPAPPPITPSRAVGATHNCTADLAVVTPQPTQDGEVLVRYDVGADGSVTNVMLIKSSGWDAMDQATLTCVREHWRNVPAMQGSTPLASPGHMAVVRFTVPDAPN